MWRFLQQVKETTKYETYIIGAFISQQGDDMWHSDKGNCLNGLVNTTFSSVLDATFVCWRKFIKCLKLTPCRYASPFGYLRSAPWYTEAPNAQCGVWIRIASRGLAVTHSRLIARLLTEHLSNTCLIYWDAAAANKLRWKAWSSPRDNFPSEKSEMGS